MAFSAITNGDRVGLVAFTDTVEHFIPPKKAPKHVLRIIDQILRFSPEGRGTNLDEVLNFIGRCPALQSRGICNFPDFMDDGFEKALNITARRHDLIPIGLLIPQKKICQTLVWFCWKMLKLVNHWLDPGSRTARESYNVAQKDAEIEFDSAPRYGVTPVTVYTDTDDYAGPLVNFFRVRARRG